MKYFLVFLSLALFCGSLEAIPWLTPQIPSTLRLVHALWRHGNRNPEQTSIWPTNPYANASYYPEGFGQLTNKGKLTEYKLGKLLRERYGNFLGDIWNINIQDLRATGYNRTKMSALLVMAGLWPPTGANTWNSQLPWQPIPYNYKETSDDQLLLPTSCSTYSTLFQETYSSDEIQNYLRGRYGEAMKILSRNTGIDETDYSSAFGYFDTMKVQKDLGYPLESWAEQLYPEPLNSLAVDMYYIWSNNTALRKLMAGSLIKKIINDSRNKAKGELSPSTRKLLAYSAHDMNVGTMILSLEAFKPTETPPYGSAVLFEVHEILGVWGIKLFYVDYSKESPRPLTIPGCFHFCPLEWFAALVEEIVPTSDDC